MSAASPLLDLSPYYPGTAAWVQRAGWDLPTFHRHPAHDTLHRLLDLSPRDEEGATTVAELVLDRELPFPSRLEFLRLCRWHAWAEDRPDPVRHGRAYRRLGRLLRAHGVRWEPAQAAVPAPFRGAGA